MLKRKVAGFLSLAMSMTLILSGCGKSSSAGAGKDLKASEVLAATNPEKLPPTARDRKDTLIIGFAAPEGKFNPIYASTVDDSYVTDIVFDGLMSNDVQGNPIGKVAKKWEISKDSKTYTFHLNKDIKFSNGEKLTAKDVEFTFTSICDPKYDGSRSDSVDKLVGYKEYHKGEAKTVEGIKVIDDYTISFTETEVKAPALSSDFGTGIMCKSYYNFEKGDIKKIKDLFLKPMGCGPYVFKNYKAGQEANFEKNPSYWDGVAKIDKVILKVTTAQTNIQGLSAGEVDMDRIPAAPENIQMLQGKGFINMQLYPENGYGFIGLNLKNEKFKDKKVRQALAYGLNRKGFIDARYKGYADVCNVPMSRVSWAYTQDINKYEYNPEKANQLLEAAGWLKKDDGFRYKDGKKFEIHWMTYQGSKYVEMLIPIVKDNWKAIGIDVIPELMEFNTLSTKVFDEQKFEMYNMSWSLSIDPDPSGIFASKQAELGGYNAGSWKNAESDKLMSEALKTTDLKERKKLYGEWLKIVNEELPYIFMDQSKEMWAVSSRVKGMDLSPYIKFTHQIAKAELIVPKAK
ncbi:ABC transporter substrate-binding protein [Clostridium tagluense]|uniref:ABC transporter substrate-binding protein n=1 Tax=Clostridium tagluense TaxID=360422 RepID=UPI001C6E7433|nr:ABC transporter substrate-binding protein [Clostridium tagluense]MBW9156571.1 peptide ABC transporter [Clostridium tagluense]WLC64743.1 peptide ABC transporter [Clostridium tagluense]